MAALRGSDRRWERSSSAEALQDYERTWTKGAAAVAAGSVVCDPPPRDGDARWGLSIIVRPDRRVSERLTAAASELQSVVGGGQLVYDRNTLHTTVRSLEAHRGEVDATDPTLGRYVDIMRGLAPRYGLSVSYDGLTLSQSGVLAQGWPLGDDMRQLRAALHSRLAAEGLTRTGPEKEGPRRTAHTSLVVFQEPPARPVALMEHVATRRYFDFGSCHFTRAEIVKYERDRNSLRLIVLESIPLKR
jgi:hypothetical protein